MGEVEKLVSALFGLSNNDDTYLEGERVVEHTNKDIIRVWTPDNVIWRKQNASKTSNMMSDMSKMKAWGDCHIGRFQIDLLVTLTYNKNGLEVEGSIDATEELKEKIVDDYNNMILQSSGLLDGLAYTLQDGLMEVANRDGKDKGIWYSTNDCLELMEDLDLDSFMKINSDKDGLNYLLNIGDYLFYISNQWQLKTIMALIMERYCDKDTPKLEGANSEVSIQGACLMAALLAKNINHPKVGSVGLQREFQEIQKANLLPRVLHEFHTPFTSNINSDRLQNLFIDFLHQTDEEKTTTKSKKVKSSTPKTTSQDSLDFDKELEEWDKVIDGVEITITRDLENIAKHNTRRLADSHYGVFLLSELVEGSIDQSDIVIMYNGIFPVEPDCSIEVKHASFAGSIPQDNIVCGILESGILFIVIDDGTMTTDLMAEFEEILCADNPYLEEVIIYDTTYKDGIKTQETYNAMMGISNEGKNSGGLAVH